MVSPLTNATPPMTTKRTGSGRSSASSATDVSAATVQLGLYAGILVAAGGFRVDELFHDGAPIFAFVVPATFVAAAFALTQRVAQVVWTPVAGRWSDRSASWAL